MEKKVKTPSESLCPPAQRLLILSQLRLACLRPSGLCVSHGVLTLLTSLCPPAGDIGGQMGLFIGASILTVLELFDYAYEVSRDGASGWGHGSVVVVVVVVYQAACKTTHHPTCPRSLSTSCADEGSARRRPKGAAQTRVWPSAWMTSKDT